MWSILLIDSDTERAHVVASGITGDWKVRQVGSTSEVLEAMRTDETITWIICSYRFGNNETATSLHTIIGDLVKQLQINMVVLVWEEDSVDSLEQLYLQVQGVELILTWEDADHAWLHGMENHGLVS